MRWRTGCCAGFALAVAVTPCASACLGVTLPAELAIVETTIEAAAINATAKCRIAIWFFLCAALFIPRSVTGPVDPHASATLTNP